MGVYVQYLGFILVLSLQNCIIRGQVSEEIRGPIFINEPPSHVIFGNTKGALIPCSAHGLPAPEMDWIREDGRSVDNIDGFLQIMANNSLYFPPFQGNLVPNIHRASYRCTAKNTAGTIVSRKVTIQGVETERYRTYNVMVNNRWVMSGNTAVFTCEINPSYVKDYVTVTAWTQGAQMVNLSGGRFSVYSSGTMHLRNVRQEDSYLTYRCVTYNRLTGDERASQPAYLHVIEQVNTAPSVEDTLNELTASEGETAEIPCVASGYPHPSYSWTKDGVNIAPQSRIQQIEGNLKITNAGIADSGEYECVMSNAHGSKTETTVLTVKKPLSAFITPDKQTIDSGLSATFNCSVSGHPIDSIAWFRNGQPLESTSRVVVQSQTTLRINDVIRQDRGMYQCLVANANENIQATAQLSLGAAKPVFSQTFGDKYVQPNTKVSLKCMVYGNPTPTVSWKLDDSPLPSDVRYSVGSFLNGDGDVVSFVNITQVRVEDGGRYVCTATNNVGSVNHMAIVNVYGVPHIRPMPNVTAVASQPLAIRCLVTGYPVDSITWSKGGIVLRTDHRVTVRDGLLTILEVQRTHDEGVYTCAATNNNNEGMNRDVYVHVMQPPSISGFRFPSLKQGDRVTVSCVVSTGDLPMNITWLKDGQPLPRDLGFTTRRIDAYSNTLTTQDANPRQNGNYSCVASNPAASANFTATMHVDVPPRWVMQPQDSFVVLGNDVLIHCQTEGTPEPVVTWKKARGTEPGNYEPIDFNQNTRLTHFPNGTLKVTNAEETDNAYYLCHSDNGIGDIGKPVFLTVHIPARFADQLVNYTVTRSQNLTVNCRAIGDKPMQISWRFNNAPLPSSNRFEKTEYNYDRGHGSRLLVAPAERQDTGYYICTAKNLFGSDSLLVYLVVQEPPDPPSNLNIEEGSSRKVTVSWRVPFDGNNAITTYIIQYKNSTDAWQGIIQNVSVTNTADVKRAEVYNLHPANSYNIRILAKNTVGLSRPSTDINVTTGEEKPSGPPLSVQVQALDSQVLKVTWAPPEKSKQNGVIQGYHIFFKIYNSSSPYRHNTVGAGVLEMLLDNLEKFTRYSIHIQAYNARGTGPSSDEKHVLTLEDVPSRPPQEVQATPLSSQSIMAVWSPPPLFTLNGILQGYKVLVKPVRDDEDESDTHIQSTTTMSLAVYGLEKFTNYSIQVLAYTRKGEGVRSDPIYVMTQQDVPGRLSDVKAFATNSSTILVTWRPPIHPNGILTEYFIYQSAESDPQTEPLKISVRAPMVKYYVSGLRKNYRYSFQVSANTMIGEGEKTRLVTASPVDQVSARIATFSHSISIQWKHDVILPCEAIGNPPPTIQWKKRGADVLNNNIRLLQNGSLLISSVQSSDAANYTCRASNTHGADEISITLVVQVPPRPPTLSVAITTPTTIQINWRSGSNGGSSIQGFNLFYQKEHALEWKTMNVGAINRTYTATELSCGTTYRFKMNARNSEGPSIYSEFLTARTNGSVPISPVQSQVLTKINSTFVELDLSTWLSGGCPIKRYGVKYKLWETDTWTTVSNDIKADMRKFVVEDLRPAEWYKMKMIAENEAGSTEVKLQFSTLTYQGSTIEPIRIVSNQAMPFYEQIHIIIPLFAGVIIIICTILAVGLYCKRRHEALQNKEVTYNLRRDITAETSLMNDLDKRINTDFEDETNPENLRNVNLLIQLDPTEDTTQSHDGNSSSWMYNQTQSDNSYPDNVLFDDDINPYATCTFNSDDHAEMQNRKNAERSPHMTTFRPMVHDQSDDSLTLEKERARQKMRAFNMDPDFPPPPPEVLAEGGGTVCQTNLSFTANSANRKVWFKETNESKKQNGILKSRQQGMILSAKKYYASAEQIHAMCFGMRLPTPPVLSTFLPNKTNRHGSRPDSSAERGSHRASTLSSITTVSSSREELLQAYENARYNPHPHPIEYTNPQSLNSTPSQPTPDSSDVTEPGIRDFTQSPPKPEETRQASCEVPMYEDTYRRRPRNITLSSDIGQANSLQRRKSPGRRTRGRRIRTRGQVIGRRVIRAPRQPPRSFSRASTVSTNSEDMYSVEEHADESPSEGYVSHQHDSYICTDSDYDPYSYGRPRSKYHPPSTPYPAYDSTPDTPGCDERKPLVSASARIALASPKEEEETSLLDRYYRAVDDEDNSQSNRNMMLRLTDSEGHYTDNFTVV